MKRCIQCDAQVEPGSGWTCSNCGFAPPEQSGIPIFAPHLLQGAGGDYPEETYVDWMAHEEQLGYWFRPRAAMIAWALRHHFPTATSFLDAGCGAGSVLEAIRVADPAIELTGADASPGALRLVSERVPGTSLLQMDATAIPFRDHFDATGSFDVIEHLDDDGAALRELRAAVKPGGGVMITVPQHEWLWSAEDEAGGHKRRYRRRGLRAAIEAAGLELERVTSYVFILLPAMAAVRFRRREITPEAALEQARQAAPGSSVLERILNAEVALTKRGVSWPAGGSLFAVARRPACDE